MATSRCDLQVLISVRPNDLLAAISDTVSVVILAITCMDIVFAVDTEEHDASGRLRQFYL